MKIFLFECATSINLTNISFAPTPPPVVKYYFTIDGNQFEFGEGMTWNEFVTSEYNTDYIFAVNNKNQVLYNDKIVTLNDAEVTPTDIVLETTYSSKEQPQEEVYFIVDGNRYDLDSADDLYWWNIIAKYPQFSNYSDNLSYIRYNNNSFITDGNGDVVAYITPIANGSVFTSVEDVIISYSTIDGSSIDGWQNALLNDPYGDIKRVYFKERLTSMPIDTLRGTNLTSIDLSVIDGLDGFSNLFFYNCVYLSSITFNTLQIIINLGDSTFCTDAGYSDGMPLTDDTVNRLLRDAQYTAWGTFYNLQKENLNLPNLVNIADYFNAENKKLTNLTIGASCESLGSCAFAGCPNLTSITCNATTAPSVLADTFTGIAETGTLIVPEGADYSSWYDVLPAGWQQPEPSANNKILYTSSDGNIITPYTTSGWGANIVNNTYIDGQGVIEFDGDVTAIPQRAFYSNKLISIVIPNSVTSIEKWAFWNCTNITTITIPSGVTSIGSAIFRLCSKLTNINVDGNNTIYDSRNNCNAIIETATNKLITGCKTTIIPNTVTMLGDYSFGYGIAPNSIIIPDSVTDIGNSVFYSNSQLTSVTIGSGVKFIRSSVFDGCGFTSIVIPDSVTSIGNSVFYNCKNLTSVTIGSRVTTIGEYFDRSANITDITSLNPIAPTINNLTFYSKKPNGVLRVPQGADYSTWLTKLGDTWTIEYI